MRAWHSLALLSLLGVLAPGCYLAHGAGGEPLDPPVDPPPSPCGCDPGELCVEACWGERTCLPAPPAARAGCDPRAECCFDIDPCRVIPNYGECVGGPGIDGILHCACMAEPPMPLPEPWPTPEPGDTTCGSDICASSEVCAEPCDAESPVCVPRGPILCEEEIGCECFAEDPCAELGARSACADVYPTDAGLQVVCHCTAPPPPGRLTCEDVLAGAPAGACDPATFGECTRPIDGVECCQRAVWCEAGVVQESVFCDDSCAQGCALIEDPGDCAAYGCEYFVNEACVSPPIEGVIFGPACIEPRTTRCGDDSECPGGWVCRGFPYDPCAGELCDACGAIDYWCTSER